MIGEQLGAWTIDRELGRGGMGRVYLAHAADGRQSAIKVLAAELAQEKGFLQRFEREIDILARLHHPNIVRFYESGSQDGHFYYAMEYIEGESFEQLLQARGKLPWPEVLDAALQICPALKHAHDQGVVHRDIKPPNLLRTSTGVVKLTDFGIAKVFAGKQLTSTGGVVGTAEYLSPEQASGKPATKRSDLYSFGVVMYTLLVGHPPFQGQTSTDLLHKHLYAQFDRPRKLVPEIPRELDDVVCQLLEKDPARRPPDGMVLHRQLDSIRRRIERKTEPQVPARPADPAVAEQLADNPGPATLMSRLVRQELDRQNAPTVVSQWLNRPWILVPLFLICVSVLGWTFWPRPRPSAQERFEAAAALMASEDPDDWRRAWREQVEPLQRDDPGHPYQAEIEGWRQRIDDQEALARALKGVQRQGPLSEAQRFYERGLRLCQEGDPESAAALWRNLVTAFRGVASEEHWVRLAEEGLRRLGDRAQATRDPAILRTALDRAQKEKGADEARRVRSALQELYKQDPWGRQALDQILKGRP